jgi:hypothetical protein
VCHGLAHDQAEVTPIEVLSDLRANVDGALELLGGLDDSDLDRQATAVDRAAVGPFYPTLQTLGQFIDEGLIGHIRVHRESLRATVGR